MPSTRVPAPVRTAVPIPPIVFSHRNPPSICPASRSVGDEYGDAAASTQGPRAGEVGRVLQILQERRRLDRQDAPGAGEAEAERHRQRDDEPRSPRRPARSVNVELHHAGHARTRPTPLPAATREERGGERRAGRIRARRRRAAAARVAPSVFRITASCRRWRWPAASAPPSTSMETTSASEAATRTAERQVGDDRVHRIDRVAHADAGHAGEGARDGGEHLAFSRSAGTVRRAAASPDGHAARRGTCWARTP